MPRKTELPGDEARGVSTRKLRAKFFRLLEKSMDRVASHSVSINRAMFFLTAKTGKGWFQM
ncbi:hypothetical protein H9L39_03334 [Fusarium oxysporum f. sp. albedinis]|nr:hypothetical protein H9L39_03334 [Fusarium oxysporum f. sp. albedinis]